MASNGKAILKYFESKQYEIKGVNLVGLEGISNDGVLNSDVLDAWNDTIMLLRSDGKVLQEANGTTEPGSYFVKYPMNTKGAAILSFGQHKNAWAHGYHNSPKHPALVQVAPVAVHRDKSGKGTRVNSPIDIGLFGINIHGTMGKHNANSIGKWSAGCSVTRSWQLHLNMLKTLLDNGYNKLVSYTLIDGSDLYKFCVANNLEFPLGHKAKL